MRFAQGRSHQAGGTRCGRVGAEPAHPACYDAAPVSVLFLENDDSFSWNVIELLPVARAQLRIVHTRHTPDATAFLDEAEMVVIGPGPMDPERVGLVEIVRETARRRLPLLGICLGHQALGLAFGATLVRTTPAHGKRASALFQRSRLFGDVTGALDVMRYHSLALAEVRAPLRVVARTADGIPMAIEHETLPMAGLQFHPDSFATPRGAELVSAFFSSVAAT